ncbi:Leucine-rich repeat 3 [Sesbania bispinosa]|nr:Leucine-rich repeat 3 [Sesbania bispinosa]
MPNLRILVFKDFNGNFRRINSVYLPMGLHSLPKNLRYFGWDGYPLKFLPPTFCPEMLVELSLQDSNVEKLWNGVQNLPNLEILDLNGSTRLIECPNLSRAPNIKHVNLSHCERLPFIDPSIFSLQKLEVLNVGACTSLKSLCSSSCPPSLRSVYALGCINLQEFSVTLLMPSATGMYLNFGGSVISGKEVGVWFHYHSIEPFVTIDELPLNLLGIVFYLVVSQVQSCYIGYGGCFGCECYLESSGGEKINITSFFVDKSSLINTLQTSLEMMCDHVVLWYDEQCCKQIMETIKGINDISNGYNPMLTFEFFAQNRFGEEVAIKECGFRWIYPSEDQNVSEFDEQEETVPSTEKFKQRVFGTPSNQETGDLR